MNHNTLQFREYIADERDINVFISTVDGHYREHSHDFIEIAYVNTGSGEQKINGTPVEIREGDLFLLNAHSVTHSFDSAEGTPLEIYNCLFRPLAFDSSLENCNDFVDVAYNYIFNALTATDVPKNYIKLSGQKGGIIESLIHEMCREFDEKQDGYMQILRSDLIKLLILIFRYYKRDIAQTQDHELYQNLMVRNAISTMKAHYREDIKCEQLARAVYLSVNYFRKIFKKVTGMTMVEMLQKIRVDASCEMLETTNMSVIDIAECVGYSDIKFFYKIFQKRKNITPGEYRAQFR